MARSAGGDFSQRLDSVLARFGQLVRHIGWRHHLSDADVDELIQDVRIRLWRARGEADDVHLLAAAYIHRTATSAALDLLKRRRARTTEPLADEAEENPLPSLGAPVVDDPSRAVESAEFSEQVFRAVDSLAPARRAVVRMHLMGYDHREIERLLGWTEGKVRNLLSRGLADLREAMTRAGLYTPELLT
jgi:RNA polymerase sigma-70 factor (ECF subfamily)